ncbi:unnamed protein product [Phytomonas sp. Hart1]|nr:unnamed protein product [Phytomonas sp. Hart1]|eukprot:CCW66016.1 unnamed protein product [Phytomonas sp. isolate Hart1]
MRKDSRREKCNPIKGNRPQFPRRKVLPSHANQNHHQAYPLLSGNVDQRRPHATKGEIPLDISFGNFDFQDLKSVGQRGGGMRELASLLRQARRKVAGHKTLLHSRAGIQMRNRDLLQDAAQRVVGIKVKNDPQRLAKSIAKRKNKKRQSAKRWAKRVKQIEDSVENVVKDRTNAKNVYRMRKEASKKEKIKRREAIKAVKSNSGGTKKGKKPTKGNDSRKSPSGRGRKK